VLIAEVFLYSAVASRRSSYNSYDGENSSDRNPAFGGIALIIALLSPVLARLLYFSISRRREYLADAMAVQYTRYPEGLASALEKISHSTEQMPRVNKFMAPLFFAEVNQVDSENISLSTATHPPIAERIRILRKIGGNPSYQAYANSFSAVHSGKPLAAGIPEGTRPLVNAGTLAAVIGASIAEQLVIKNGERHILCKCGSEIKLPPGFGTNRPLVKCSHCGIIHDVSPYY
jgi:heat shock protein HtpX